MTRRQCIPARLDQYVNHDPRLTFKARLVFTAQPLLAQLRQIPGLYSRPGLYLRPGFYIRGNTVNPYIPSEVTLVTGVLPILRIDIGL